MSAANATNDPISDQKNSTEGSTKLLPNDLKCPAEEDVKLLQDISDHERLIKARKSLTRTSRIELSVDSVGDNQISSKELELTKSNINGSNCLTPTCNENGAQNGPNYKFPTSPDPKKCPMVSQINPENNGIENRLLDDYDNKDQDEESNSEANGRIVMKKFSLKNRSRASRIIHETFVDPEVETLFQEYHGRQRHSDLFVLLLCGVFLGVYGVGLIGIYEKLTKNTLIPIVCLSASAIINLVLSVLCIANIFPEKGWPVLPYIAWTLTSIELITFAFFTPLAIPPRQALIWLIFLDFLYLAVLPVRHLEALTLSVSTTVAYYVTVFIAQSQSSISRSQVAGSILLVIGTIVLGLMSYFFADKKHRRAFLETRKSLEVKMVIEVQSQEQERLLLSVLPQHVAEKMRQELGTAGAGQFKKIYMSRHENVSILFADIVGFTAISSTYTACELVKMLNELFARFDGLAEKYDQLRIKILGDCYYCISGAPKERADHAILCVHMGLSMIEAIQYVRENTKCGVDMRVGIHTGAVLAGVLGQRQWQYDVYSKDVFLANKMESSGKSGRVHVSSTTLQFLDNHFGIEPAFGEKREDALRGAMLKTYFITDVLVPHKTSPSLAVLKNGSKMGDSSLSSQPSKDVSGENNLLASRDSMNFSTIEESKMHVASTKHHGSFAKKLQKELMSKNRRSDLKKKTTFITFQFRDREIENAFRAQRETFSGATTTCVVFVVIIITIVRFTLDIRSGLRLVVLPVCLLLIVALTLVPAARSFKLSVSECFAPASDWLYSGHWRRSFWFGFLPLLSFIAVALDMYLCGNLVYSLNMDDSRNNTESNDAYFGYSEMLNQNYSKIYGEKPEDNINSSRILNENAVSNSSSWRLSGDPAYYCAHASFYSYFTLLILSAAALLAQMNFLFKVLLLFLACSLQCVLNVFLITESTQVKNFSFQKLSEGITLSIELILITVLLSILCRQIDAASRLLYLWRREVEDQRNRAEQIRERNEALVYNILPAHVAVHFMGMKRKKHEELYSQAYDEVGVLFASMPNFADFYSEESVNNQGLECYRFLNEVISDFDALLESPPYNEITKIKTIGSTYMAASGLNLSRKIQSDGRVKIRWAHLSLLVDFAFELVKALQLINEQSFNHFVLRMGVNHGPIIAGVIGARKPHYDIWGNTVNVASRMESTGKAGRIQLTEETTNILRHFHYEFEQRGLIAVKGKGELLTYYLVKKTDGTTLSAEKNCPSPNMF